MRLMAGKHRNKKVQRCFSQKQVLFFRVLRYVEVNQLKRMEQEAIERYAKHPGLLNMTKTAAHHHGRNFKQKGI
jgi:hypothetical protein